MLTDVERCLVVARRTLAGGELSVRRCGGACQLYEQLPAANPNTSEQQAVRGAVSRIAEAWRSLSVERQTAWKAVAKKLMPEFRQSRGQLTGYMLFSHCAHNCLTVGASLPGHPPAGFRPNLPAQVVLQRAVGPKAFSFLIRHGIKCAECGSYRVLTQMTSPSPRCSHAPEPRNGRLICGFGAASAPPLPPSGGVIEFAGARYAVSPGQRFGVWMRIMHLPDGLSSEDLFLDLLRS